MSDMLSRLTARAQASPVVLDRRIGYRFAPAADYQEAWPGAETQPPEQISAHRATRTTATPPAGTHDASAMLPTIATSPSPTSSSRTQFAGPDGATPPADAITPPSATGSTDALFRPASRNPDPDIGPDTGSSPRTEVATAPAGQASAPQAIPSSRPATAPVVQRKAAAMPVAGSAASTQNRRATSRGEMRPASPPSADMPNAGLRSPQKLDAPRLEPTDIRAPVDPAKQDAVPPGHAIAEAHSTTASAASTDILSSAEAPTRRARVLPTAPHSPAGTPSTSIDQRRGNAVPRPQTHDAGSMASTAPAAEGAAQARAGSPLSFDGTPAPSHSQRNPVARPDGAPAPLPLRHRQAANPVAPDGNMPAQRQTFAARTRTHREPHETRAALAGKESGDPPVPDHKAVSVSSARATAPMPAHRGENPGNGLSVSAPIPPTPDRPSATGPEQPRVRAYPPALQALDAEGAAPGSRQASRRSPAPAGELRIDIGRIDIEIPRSRSSARRPQPPPLKTRTRGGPDA